jgi:hypothetical protein
MVVGIIDAVTFQISRVLESVFDEIEYRKAKNASARMAKQTREAQRVCEGYCENGPGEVTLEGLTQPHSARRLAERFVQESHRALP